MVHPRLFFGVEILKSSTQEQGFLRTGQLLKQLKPNIKQSQLLKWSESATRARYCQGPESSKLGEGPCFCKVIDRLLHVPGVGTRSGH